MNMNIVKIEKYLPLVDKPSRYIDNEINAIHKAFEEAEVRFCLAFPDIYELGISHLGLKILYSIINRIPWAMADRSYLPWVDMIKLMREEKLPLFGLESRMPHAAFDVLGITLQTELNFSNVLELLDLSGLPVLASERNATHPIVLAGGPCVSNPLPLSPFIDVFFLGEAEEGIVEIAELLHANPGKEDRLQALAKLESCYVPAIHDAMITENPDFRIKARKYAKFHKGEAIHSPQLQSWQLATHNRMVSEIMRGCSRGCRFCHAGYFYRPVRERNADDLLENILREIRDSGWDEAGLISLSSSDYSCIKPLLLNLFNSIDTNKTHISLPSLRVDSLDNELVSILRGLGREGLTIAPEAGSQRLRNVINKNLSEEEILRGASVAIDLGWQKIKLYFMIGLPTETEEDIDGIIDLIEKIESVGKKKVQINVTLSPFVPKVFTPFQWESFAPLEQSLARILRVKQHFIKKRYIKIKYHELESSLLEALLSRGDLNTAKVIHKAWLLGASFDGWNEFFDFSIWRRAFEECELSAEQYLASKDPDQPAAWEFVDTGVCRSFFISELHKARKADLTDDCRELCSLCGVCDESVRTTDATDSVRIVPPANIPSALETSRRLQEQYHYRVSYRKAGMLRLISHLDWMRMLFRWIGIVKLETVFTQGFSPHPKVSLSPPLPVGVSGEQEYFDISFFRIYLPQEIIAHFNELRIPDFEILGVEALHKRQTALIPLLEELRINFDPGHEEAINAAIHAFLQQQEFLFTKTKDRKTKTYNLSDIIQTISTEEGMIHIIKKLESPSLYSILEAILQLPRAMLYQFDIVRLRLLS